MPSICSVKLLLQYPDRIKGSPDLNGSEENRNAPAKPTMEDTAASAVEWRFIMNENKNKVFQQNYGAERGRLLRDLAGGSTNLLIFTVLSVVNVLLTLAQASITFTFSAEIPTYLTALGMYSKEITGSSFMFVIFLTAAMLFIGFCLICALFSKKRYGWFIPALVLVIIDTFFAVWAYSPIASEMLLPTVISILFHVWMLYYLVKAILAMSKLKKLPPEPAIYEAPFTESPNQEPYPPSVSYENIEKNDFDGGTK